MPRETILQPGDPTYATGMPVDTPENRRLAPELFNPEILAAAKLPPNGLTRPVYKGSIQGKCSDCPIVVWVGPQLQQMMSVNPNVALLCPVCAVKVSAMMGRPLEIRSATHKVFGE